MKIACMDWNSVIPDFGPEVEKVHVDALKTADALLVWTDRVHRPRELCKSAKARGIPTFVLQHGWSAWGVNPTWRPDYSVQEPMVADYMLVWSERDRKIHEVMGIPSDRIIVVGAPILEDMPPHIPDGKTVVFAPMHREKDADRNFWAKENGLIIWDRLRKLGNNIELVAKVLKGENDYPVYTNAVVTYRGEDAHRKAIWDLLQKTSCLVVQEEGTLCIFAYAMGIPVLKVKSNIPPFTEAIQEVTLDELPHAVLESLQDPSKFNDQRVRVIQSVGDGIVNPSERILQAIQSKVKVPA